MKIVSFEDFSKIDIRVGLIVEAIDFPEARKPALKLKINFGDEIGTKKSSAQITYHYHPAELVGKNIFYTQAQILMNRISITSGNRFQHILINGFINAKHPAIITFEWIR